MQRSDCDRHVPKPSEEPQMAVQLAAVPLLERKRQLQRLVVQPLCRIAGQLHALLKQVDGDALAVVPRLTQRRVVQLQVAVQELQQRGRRFMAAIHHNTAAAMKRTGARVSGTAGMWLPWVARGNSHCHFLPHDAEVGQRGQVGRNPRKRPAVVARHV